MGKRLSVKHQNKHLSEKSTEIPLNGIISVGNDASATIELPDVSIAPEQFVLVCEPDQIILMCRVDGTIINGTLLSQGSIHNLQDGDVVEIGEYVFMLENDEIPPKPLEISLPPEEESSDIHDSKSDRTLTDVLKSLRSEERFYFQIEKNGKENQRLFVENEEAFLGKNKEGNFLLTTDKDEIEKPTLQIRKDWSGVIAYPLPTEKVWLVNKILNEPHRLKNDDIVYLQDATGFKPDLDIKIKFHEPTALLVLDSLLPKELPPPISLDETEAIDETTDEKSEIHTSKISPITKAKKNRLFFGYFTLTEIIIMIFGTLITAAIIFLVLEFY